MANRDIKSKTVAELREMATRRGIPARKNWKKKDFIMALSSKKKTPVKDLKPARRKTPAKKTLSVKSAARKSPVRKAGPAPLKQPPEVVLSPLPAEYGEDKVVSMQVSPKRIYVYWEVPEERLLKHKGSLNIKVSDVKADSFFYTPVSGRLGELFVNINPESHYTVELGVIDFRGEFVNIMKQDYGTSEIRTTPSSSPSVLLKRKKMPSGGQSEKAARADESVLPEEFFEVPESVSSY
ncbi:MAG: DUF4912 domain-containing protein [Nitrospirae bacterium]|nr:DUF4912 domain-containing protein [Nitrospirota bacterium]